MDEPTRHSGLPARARFHLEQGLDVLEAWVDKAPKSATNVVYKALFAMIDGSIFRTYRIIDDLENAVQENKIERRAAHDIEQACRVALDAPHPFGDSRIGSSALECG